MQRYGEEASRFHLKIIKKNERLPLKRKKKYLYEQDKESNYGK